MNGIIFRSMSSYLCCSPLYNWPSVAVVFCVWVCVCMSLLSIRPRDTSICILFVLYVLIHRHIDRAFRLHKIELPQNISKTTGPVGYSVTIYIFTGIQQNFRSIYAHGFAYENKSPKQKNAFLGGFTAVSAGASKCYFANIRNNNNGTMEMVESNTFESN